MKCWLRWLFVEMKRHVWMPKAEGCGQDLQSHVGFIVPSQLSASRVSRFGWCIPHEATIHHTFQLSSFSITVWHWYILFFTFILCVTMWVRAKVATPETIYSRNTCEYSRIIRVSLSLCFVCFSWRKTVNWKSECNVHGCSDILKLPASSAGENCIFSSVCRVSCSSLVCHYVYSRYF